MNKEFKALKCINVPTRGNFTVGKTYFCGIYTVLNETFLETVDDNNNFIEKYNMNDGCFESICIDSNENLSKQSILVKKTIDKLQIDTNHESEQIEGFKILTSSVYGCVMKGGMACEG